MKKKKTEAKGYKFEELILVHLFRSWGWPEDRIERVMNEVEWREHPKVFVEPDPENLSANCTSRKPPSSR